MFLGLPVFLEQVDADVQVPPPPLVLTSRVASAATPSGLDPAWPYDHYAAGAVRSRDGALDELVFGDLDGDAAPDIVVVVRSAGSGRLSLCGRVPGARTGGWTGLAGLYCWRNAMGVAASLATAGRREKGTTNISPIVMSQSRHSPHCDPQPRRAHALERDLGGGPPGTVADVLAAPAETVARPRCGYSFRSAPQSSHRHRYDPSSLTARIICSTIVPARNGRPRAFAGGREADYSGSR